MEETGGKEIEINFDGLLKQNFAVIDVRYKDYEITDEKYKYIITKFIANRDSFYSDMLNMLTGIKLKEDEAIRLWQDILKHKLLISQKLDRDISIKVAAIDYMETKE